MRLAAAAETGPVEEVAPELLRARPLSGVSQYHGQAAQAESLVLVEAVGPAVLDCVVESELGGRIVAPVVRSRAERPVREGRDLGVVLGERDLEPRAQERNPRVTVAEPPGQEALRGQGLRLQIATPCVSSGGERTFQNPLELHVIVVPHAFARQPELARSLGHEADGFEGVRSLEP